MNGKPNFILIMTDQQRADLRASRGFALDTMPFLDSLSEKGCDFTNSYTPNPICMAARVSLFTGRTPETHKVRSNHNFIDATYTKDLLDVLKEKGYKTALCGKNHSHRRASDFDFAKVNGHLGGEGEINATSEEKEFSDFLKSTNHLESDIPSPGGTEVQFPFRNVRDALEFIDGRDKDSPFFLWISMAEPHNPSQVPYPYFDMFPRESLPKITNESALESKSRRFKELRAIWEEVLGENINDRILRTRSNYYGMLSLIDDQIKRLYNGLSERELLDNTYIIYLSDHGDFVGEYGLLRKGVELPDILTKIPTVWIGPNIKPRRCPYFISLIDILPTVCDIIDAPIPDGVQGKSYLSLLKGDDTSKDEFDTAYMESGYGGLIWNSDDALTPEEEGTSDKARSRYDCLNTWTQSGVVRALRYDRYKIQLDSEENGFLYDLESDPLELVNLWDNPSYSQTKIKMLTLLSREMMNHYDPLPYPHHRYRYKKHPLGFKKVSLKGYNCEVSSLRSYKGHITDI